MIESEFSIHLISWNTESVQQQHTIGGVGVLQLVFHFVIIIILVFSSEAGFGEGLSGSIIDFCSASASGKNFGGIDVLETVLIKRE
jgi:hypothetical protein